MQKKNWLNQTCVNRRYLGQQLEYLYASQLLFVHVHSLKLLVYKQHINCQLKCLKVDFYIKQPFKIYE